MSSVYESLTPQAACAAVLLAVACGVRPLSDYTAILWDWNGTLLNDVWLVVEVMNGLLERRAKPTTTAERYRSVFDFPVQGYYEQMGFDLEAEDFGDVSAEFLGAYNARAQECSLHEGAREMLVEIRETGTRQWVLSATQHDTLQEVVRRFELDHLFESMHGLSDNLARSKTALGAALLKDAGIDPANALLVGDTTHDFEVANEVGADCLLFASGHQTRERLEPAGVPIIDSYAGLRRHLTDGM